MGSYADRAGPIFSGIYVQARDGMKIKSADNLLRKKIPLNVERRQDYRTQEIVLSQSVRNF
jgi:hypothetical protein